MPKIWHHLQKKKKPVPAEGSARSLGGARFRKYSTFGAMLLTVALAYPLINRDPDTLVVNTAQVTECDRLAAHPSDTQKLAPGVAQGAMDIPKAKEACAAALKNRPKDGRTLYQLGRAYFYNDEKSEGIAYFRQSDAAGYAQGQFVLGLVFVQGNGIEPDSCAGGQLWVKAARQRHLYSKIYLATNWLDGMFKNCALDITEAEIDEMVSATEELAETPQQKDDVAQLKTTWAKR